MRRHPVNDDDLSAYVDGRASPSERRRINDHLAACPACRRRAEDYRLLASALRQLPEAAVPRSFALSPEQVGGAEPATPPVAAGRLYPALRGAAAAVAVLLFAFVGADVFLQVREEPVEERQAVTLGAAREEEKSQLAEGAATVDEENAEDRAVGEEDLAGAPSVEGTAAAGFGEPPLPAAAGPPTPTVPPPPVTPLPVAPEEAPAEAGEGDEDWEWLRPSEIALAVGAVGLVAAALWTKRRRS